MQKIILITRDRMEVREDGESNASSSSNIKSMIAELEGKGFNLVLHKTIDVVRDEERVINALNRFISSEYDFIVFMSVSAVRFIIDAIHANGLEPSILNDRCYVIAVGPSTRDELVKNGVKVDLIPSRYSSYGLIELFRSIKDDPKYSDKVRVFIPRSREASTLLADALTSLGFRVDEEHIYRIVPSRHDGWKKVAEYLANGSLHYIIFTSSSSVNAFFTLINEYSKDDAIIDAILKNGTGIVAIGPLTADTLRAYGLNPYVADEHTVHGTLKLLLKIVEDIEYNP
ncbi:MAG: uroporphyrinogen-III synthase [Candidatus Nitrosocaldus sp.]